MGANFGFDLTLRSVAKRSVSKGGNGQKAANPSETSLAAPFLRVRSTACRQEFGGP